LHQLSFAISGVEGGEPALATDRAEPVSGRAKSGNIRERFTSVRLPAHSVPEQTPVDFAASRPASLEA
jgi:hypothetical protein